MTIRDSMQRASTMPAWGSTPAWFAALLLGVALGGAACGNVTIEDADVASQDAAGNDDAAGTDATVADSTAGSDDAGTDATGDDTVGADTAGADTTGTDTTGTDTTVADGTTTDATDTTTGPTFAGQALLVFDQDSTLAGGKPVSWRKTLLHVFGSAQPPSGHAYVWWIRVAADDSLKRVAVLPYEDVPYVADFTAAMPIPSDVKEQPIQLYIGASVTLETEVDASTATAPKGPVVWEASWVKGVWVHLVHSLAAKPEGGAGYLQEASIIANYVEAQRQAGLAAFKTGDIKGARAAVERAFNALVGVANAKDIDFDGKAVVEAPIKGGLKDESTSPLAHGVKHIGFAQAAWPGGKPPAEHPFAVGFGLLQTSSKSYATELEKALGTLETFAAGQSTNFKDSDTSMQALHAVMGDVMNSAVKVATLPVELPKK